MLSHPGCISHHVECSQDWLHIYCDPEQDKALTERMMHLNLAIIRTIMRMVCKHSLLKQPPFERDVGLVTITGIIYSITERIGLCLSIWRIYGNH